MSLPPSAAPSSVDAAYQRFFPLIRAKCQRMLSDIEEAQDVAQETFVRLWKTGPLHRDTDAIVAWVYCTSTRLVIDRLRQRRTRATFETLTALLPGVSASLEARTAIRQQLHLLARELSSEAMEFLILERLDGMTQDEIALALGMSTRSVRRLSLKVQHRLERLLQEHPS